MTNDDELTPTDDELAANDSELSQSDDELTSVNDTNTDQDEISVPTPRHNGFVAANSYDTGSLAGMYRNWYLDYASYVILERAVPHIEDGLKPVQRRILHAMQTLDDGRYNKVANIVGTAMQYHPHGDASIGDAIVQLGQKELLVDTQGNWGNIITGDSAAAPRYIEARLSPFALETLFSPKITEWTMSYDGRKREPVTLPAKFPLLLAQGVEGIAVGLSSKILPHNFIEICDAAIDYLQGKEFSLLPDFQTGGLMDAGRYNDGARGGAVKVRARIEKLDSKTLAITEIPFGKTTATLIASIQAAAEKGKIKIRHLDNNTTATARIIVQLQPGTSSDKAIDALYAFTDCEVSISPNCCVICDHKPRFMSVSELLRYSVDHTRELLRRELEIRLDERREDIFFASLERLFISERMYKHPEVEQALEMEAVLARLRLLFEPWLPRLTREISDDDLIRLWEIRMKRILSFNVQAADDRITALEAEMEKLQEQLAHITEHTIKWFRHLRDTYGHNFARRTELRSFDSIEATKVAEANCRLYYDKAGGFLGTALKEGDFKSNCSDLDDILIVNRNGTYRIVKTPRKLDVGKKVIHVAPFKKGDNRTVYNVVYRNGKGGFTYKKRFTITGMTRDRIYDITRGLPGSQILYFSANPNGEAQVVRAVLKEPKQPTIPGLKIDGRRGLKNTEVEVNFAELAIKGRDTLGNLVTKHDVAKVEFDRDLGSTLGGREVWFDPDVLRINYDGRGTLLGTFQGNDLVVVLTKNGEFYTTSYAESNHYDPGILFIEKFDPEKVWTVALFDREAGYTYLKRFRLEPSARRQVYAPVPDEQKIYLVTGSVRPQLEIEYGGHDRHRLPTVVDAEEFVGVKSFKAKGKRLSQYKVRAVREITPPEEPEVVETDYEDISIEPNRVQPENMNPEIERESDNLEQPVLDL